MKIIDIPSAVLCLIKIDLGMPGSVTAAAGVVAAAGLAPLLPFGVSRMPAIESPRKRVASGATDLSLLAVGDSESAAPLTEAGVLTLGPRCLSPPLVGEVTAKDMGRNGAVEERVAPADTDRLGRRVLVALGGSAPTSTTCPGNCAPSSLLGLWYNKATLHVPGGPADVDLRRPTPLEAAKKATMRRCVGGLGGKRSGRGMEGRSAAGGPSGIAAAATDRATASAAAKTGRAGETTGMGWRSRGLGGTTPSIYIPSPTTLTPEAFQ
jgi:hypothetical protein